MNNVPAALEEMDRAIGSLGARGVQIFTNVNGRPLDYFRMFYGDTSVNGSASAIR
jgi:aminocarboxymuconate-semialdehyde decarboxylase